jgi:predicted alpha/beta-fold hydrolase
MGLPHVVGAFVPPPGLRHRHVQSLLAGSPWRQRWIRRRAARLLAASRDEIVDCGDGVRLLGHFSAQPQDSRGLAVLLHGWEGSAAASYVVSVGSLLYESGYDVFRLNFRDHGETFALNRDLFHSCRIDEVVGALRSIVRLHDSPNTFLVGHSLGGNFALRAASGRLSPCVRCCGRTARCVRSRKDCGSIGSISCAAGVAACSLKRRASRISTISGICGAFRL